MNLSTAQGNTFVDAYSLVRRSGFLQTSLGRRLFKSAYFLYKRYFEDDLRDLVRFHPALVSGGMSWISARTSATRPRFWRGPQSLAARFMPSSRSPLTSKFCSRRRLSPSSKAKSSRMQCAVGAKNGTIDLWVNHHHHADHRIATQKFRLEHPESNQSAQHW